MDKILVTGGAGFIGSHLVDRLLEKNNQVCVVDNFDPFYPRNIKEKNIIKHLNSNNYSFHEIDICDYHGLSNVFSNFKPDYVVHLAARAGVRPSVECPRRYIDTNIIGTSNLLELSVQSNTKKFVFGSSSSVYGLNKEVPFNEESPLLNVASPYGATKISGESLCKSFNNCYSLPIVILRFFTVYGPRQRPDLAIHKFIKKIFNNEKITLYGNGRTKRDYTYVGDIINGIEKSIYFQKSVFEIFNLGNNHPVELMSLVNIIENIIGKKAVIEWIDDQVGDVPATWANIEKAKSLLDYQPLRTLDNGISEFVKWYQENL